MAKKSKRKKLTDKLDKLIREFIRERDENTCQKCGKYIEGSNSQPSHVVAKKNGANWRRFDLINIFLCCNACHRWWHLNPTESGVWFTERWPARNEYLAKYRGGKPAIISTAEMEDLVETMEQKLKEIKDE